MTGIRFEEFVLGGLAACCAGLFTNPVDVIKTRMQLQGELQERGTYVKPYKNVLSGGFTIAKYEGIFALQKGLLPALSYQFVMNSIRIGIYQTLVNKGLTVKQNGDIHALYNFLAAACSGGIAAFCSSPLYLMKTHLQVQSKDSLQVGYRHHHTGSINGYKSIYMRQGITGLWRGASASVLRVTVGSASQLGSFVLMKHYLPLNKDHVSTSIVSGMIAGLVTVTVINPLDVISTRVYNQPVSQQRGGLLYSGVADCISKLAIKEGVSGFYKGYFALFLRLWPHTVLHMTFWDSFRRMYINVNSRPSHLPDSID